MIRSANVRALSLLVLAAVAAGCSGSSGADPTGAGVGGNFLVLGTEPLTNGRLFLNDPIAIDFSNPVDLTTADLNSVSFQVFDANGNPLQEQPFGSFELGTSPGDATPGRRLLFVPRFPTNNTYDNGGFRPGRTYLMNLIGGDRHNGVVLLDLTGRHLLAAVTFQFSTADGTSPAELFRNRAPGGPRRIDFGITPAPDLGVALNKLSGQPVELRLVFDQPVNPHSDNVPVALETNPLLRNLNDRGRIYLEYDDPEFGDRQWIPADVDLEANELDRAVVLIRPVGVLPNHAEIRVIVEKTFEDISGESNVANAAYNKVFASFRTQDNFEPQFDALVEEFKNADFVDFDAPFLEPPAELSNGTLRASFDFEGTPTGLEYRPQAAEVRLNTDFTQIVPHIGLPFNVSGGVFNFKNVFIPDGVTVRGEGTNPMIWLVGGDFRVAGTLTVRGGDGDRVNVLNSANFPTAAGPGTCAGGTGGRGSPNSTTRSMQGETGFGPGNRPAGGGRPGLISCQGGCGRGSGGGGGSMSTQGDPFYKRLAGVGTEFQQQVGIGGQGCNGNAGAASRTLQGGSPGPVAFSDAPSDNDFWGNGVNVNRQIRIPGELAAPVGGAGGGGGGDLSNSAGCNPNAVNFINDPKGGGGGGGGGVLIVKALGRIIIEDTGNINADGGHGGGGEQAGSCNQGGGGGSGSGGMVILMAGKSIEIFAHGTPARTTYADNDYSFAVSADGGVCRTGSFSTPNISSKYPASGQQPQAGTNYDSKPLGALGGMGIVQLMVPPGDPTGPNVDGTNTVLDDNIIVYDVFSTQTSGQNKVDILAWRGFPNEQGVLVDDFGVETNIGANEGDIRPSPILLPVPYSAKTRARSEWLDFGFARREPIAFAPPANENRPRSIIEESGLLAGPTYEFAGVQQSTGYVQYDELAGGLSVEIHYPTVLSSPAAISSVTTGDPVEGAATYSIELQGDVLGNVANRYSQYEAEFYDSNGTKVGSFRILAHTESTLQVAAADGALPASAATVQVLAKFFSIETEGVEGLGPTYRGFVNARPVPNANVKIGFAFHQDPADPAQLAQRYPADPTEFVYDLEDEQVQKELRLLGATYVQWDILFDTQFRSVPEDVPPPFGPSSPRPALRFLRLPFRF